MSQPIKITKLETEHYIVFEFHSLVGFTADEAKLVQKMAGYDIMGYGFYDFRCFMVPCLGNRSYYKVSWRCNSHCD